MKTYRKSKNYYYYRKQKLYGLLLLALGALLAIITNGNIVPLIVLAVPASLMLFTKSKIIYDD